MAKVAAFTAALFSVILCSNIKKLDDYNFSEILLANHTSVVLFYHSSFDSKVNRQAIMSFNEAVGLNEETKGSVKVNSIDEGLLWKHQIA